MVAPRWALAAHDYPIHFDGPMVHHGAPFDGRRGDLPHFEVMFHSGPVQVTTRSYAIYWRPTGTFMSRKYLPLLDQFLTDAGGSRIYGVTKEYYGSNGQVRNQSTFGGSWTDTSPYPANITDEAIQDEVLKAMDANDWRPGLHSSFFVMTAKGAIKNVGFCAYHSAFNFRHDAAQPVVYAFVPYVGALNGCDPPYGISPNNDVASDGSIISISHEQDEMVTDPTLNAWYDPNNGEIGDICIFAFGVPFGPNGSNIVINEHPYFLQEEWSQQSRSCQPNL
ncbi:MAG: hypothetical protein JO043_08090 [Candidatus Eremiobacteraeota bacterium]|nr:hypothetical protein [Candidatus Eremiobacteraeota bacterium]